MNCDEISKILDDLKVNASGSIRGKNRAVDKIHSMHFKKIDSTLTEIRVFIAKNSNPLSKKLADKIDEFIYQKQIL